MSDTNIKPKYSGSLAIRALIKKENLKFLNEKNISLFFGPNIHLLAYAVNNKNEFNLVAIIRKNLRDESFLNKEENIRQFIKNSIIFDLFRYVFF